MAEHYRTRAELRVEGRNDLFAIAHLLEKHHFQMGKSPRDLQIYEASIDDLTSGREQLLKSVTPAVKALTDKAVGFVIDADASVVNTWDAVRNRIQAATASIGGGQLPREFPSSGFVSDIAPLRGRVGVWIMPDNSSPGILEDFLRRLIRDNDLLLPIAESSTSAAKAAGARFRDVARSKAVVHAWLAWQKDPGCHFSVAIKARYFDHEASAATDFVAWVRRLIA